MSYVFNYQSGAGSNEWQSICINALGNILYAVVYSGYIYTSINYGVTWTQKTSDVARNWYSIYCNSTGSIVAAAPYGGYIYISTDYGNTWIARATDSTRNWSSICINSIGDRLAAVVSGGRIYTSSDYGNTWVAYDVNRSWETICINSEGNQLAACVNNGFIYTSSNYGNTWVSRESSRSWVSICINSIGDRIAAVAIGSSVYISTDYGVTWTPRDSARVWSSICSNSEGNRLVACVGLDSSTPSYPGYIYTSTDYGVSWKPRGVPITEIRFAVCCNLAGDKIAAIQYYSFGSTNNIYTANVYYTYKGNILEDVLATGTNVTLTGYRINGTAPTFLTPFYKGTDYHAITDLSANISVFKYINSQPEICPAYILHADTGTGFSIPYGVTKMFVVCIGGGGGGGGGGVRGSGYTGGSAGGGGGGALNAWFITSVVGQITYTVTIGGGGLYGQPNNGTGIAEGAEDGAGNPTQGTDGANGGNTTFTYNSINYISNGGQGGHGGIGGSGSAQNGDGNGGAGGAVTSTPTPYASRVGANGVNGSIGGGDNPGGIGGESGNKRGASQRFLINNSYINVQPFSPYTSATDPPAPNSTYNNDRICYGDGGRGGRSEGAGWGWAGYSGLKGCVIVFFYY
jgi:hypothetical protein